MQGPSALAASPAVEGAFVFGAYNIAATVNAGPAGSLRAGVGGAIIGRFGWAGPDGVVLNARTLAEDIAGIVMPQYGPGVDWRQVFYDEALQVFRIRQGLGLTMLSRGNVWVRFAGGAVVGQQVYANLLDGSAISGYSAAGELTPWSVASPAQPGGLAIVTTWSTNG
jgi:hypothetical protein